MSDRHTIYELLEEAHEVSYPHYSVGAFLKAIDEDIGPLDKLEDGEVVRRLSGYVKQPFHKHPSADENGHTTLMSNSFF
jgi:hypothetical protein